MKKISRIKKLKQIGGINRMNTVINTSKTFKINIPNNFEELSQIEQDEIFDNISNEVSSKTIVLMESLRNK